MRKTNKKGFTIVELVIVIAVIAILAAVLIPTFASIIKKANESADIQAARQMNTALAAASVTDKPDSELELIEILAEAGFNSEKALKPGTKGCAFYWYKPENLIVLARTEGAEATAQVVSILILPVSAADGDPTVSLLYPDPEDQAEDLIDGIVTAIRANDASKIFNLEHGKDWLNAIINDEIKHVEGVELDAETEVISRGSYFTLTATLNPNDATIPEVRWHSTDPEILEVVPNGNSATIKALKSGSATVVVTTVDNGHTDTCTVTVIDPVTDVDIFYGETEVTAGSVNLVKDYSKETTLSAKVSPEGADNTVTWESNNKNVVTVANGVLTVVGAGEATITVTSASYPTITASCTVVVTNIEVTSINLNETEVALNNTDKTTVQLNATVETTPSDATKPGVNWSSDKTGVATVENGVVTAVAPGTATITAACGGKETTCKVTVTHYVTGVTLPVPSITMNTGDTASLPEAIVAPNTAANQEVSWSVTEGADVVKIEGSTIKALKEGTATITVTTNDGAKTATCTVSVSDIPADSVTISGAKEIIVGNTTTLTATVTPSNATNQTVNWSSNNTDVATVDENGVVTANSVGKVTITATVQDGSNNYDTFEIEVKPVRVSSVTLDKTDITLDINGKDTLTHTINPSDAPNKTVSWTSSDSTVATVENGVVTALKSGTATITATATDGSGVKAECTVTVTDVYAVDTRDELMAVLTNGGKAKLTADVTLDVATVVPQGVTVTLDLNGRKLILEDPSTEEEAFHVIQVFGTLNINDNTKAGEIVINSENENNEYAYYLCGICIGDPDGEVAGGELNLDGVNITGNRECNIENYASTSLNNVAFTVNCGTGLYSAAGTVYINDSTLVAAVDAGTQISCEGGEMYITGTEEIGTKFVEGSGFKGYSGNTPAPICVTGEGTKVTLGKVTLGNVTLGGNVTVTTNNGARNIDASSGCEVVINSGTFNGPLVCAGDANNKTTITINDGTFNDVICSSNAKVTINGGTFKSVTCNTAEVYIYGGTFTEKFVFDGQEFFIYIKDGIKDGTICGETYEQLTKDSDIFVKAVAAVPDIVMNKTYKPGFWTIGRKDTISCKDHTGGTATCKEQAKCDICGESYGPLAAHTEVIDSAKAPTCTETGLTEGKHCDVCGEILVAQNVVPAKDHTPGDEATCTAPQTCTVCGITLAAVKPHTEIVDEAVAPTCTTTGLTEGKHCSVCGLVIVAQEAVQTNSHTYDKWAYDDDDHWKVCSCGDIDSESEEKHNYVDGKCECGRVNVPTHTVHYDFDDGNAEGKFGNALDLKNDSMNMGDKAYTIPNDADEFTVSFWIKGLENVNTTKSIIFTNQSNSGDVGWRLSIYNTGKVAFVFDTYVDGRNCDEKKVEIDKELVTDKWCHVIFIVNKKDGKLDFIFNTYTTDEVKLYTYLNDGLGGITGISAIGQYTDETNTDDRFGYPAYLDDFRIFDHALTPDEITALKAYYA